MSSHTSWAPGKPTTAWGQNAADPPDLTRRERFHDLRIWWQLIHDGLRCSCLGRRSLLIIQRQCRVLVIAVILDASSKSWPALQTSSFSGSQNSLFQEQCLHLNSRSMQSNANRITSPISTMDGCVLVESAKLDKAANSVTSGRSN